MANMDDLGKDDLESHSFPPDVSGTNANNDKTNTTSTIQQQPNDTINPPTQLDLPPWRRNLLLASLFTGLFLSFLDSTIVSVALATIASQFHDFEHATWVVTAYLLAYMSFAIIIARLSDIFGRKTIEIASFLMFIGFSLGCGLSRNMTQLIVFRALQGVGGSGLYSMTMIIALQIVPMSKIGMISGIIGMVLVLAGVLGPILSGAITGDQHSSTWRWIFYMNVPIGGVALILLKIAWPRDRHQRSFTMKGILSLDVLGSLLLLAASVLLIFALQEAGALVYAWNSSMVIACLCVSGVSFVAFVVWQELLDRHQKWPVQLVFPMRVARQRVVGTAMLVTTFSGFVFYVAVINLPQRFQIVDQDSPVVAGVKLLPMMVASAVGSLTGGAVNRKRNFTPFTLMAGSAFQLLGYGLMSTLGDDSSTPPKQYGFQVFLGLGFGIIMPSVTIIAQLHAPTQWLSVTQGALTQMRSLGGSIGLAIGVIVFNSQIRASKELTSALTAREMAAVLKSPLVIAQLTPEQQAMVSRAYASAFTQEMRVATYIAAACFVVSVLTLQKHPPQPDFGETGMEAKEAVQDPS